MFAAGNETLLAAFLLCSDGVRRSGATGQESSNKMGEEDDSLSLVKDNSHNSSFELITSYQRSLGRGVSNSSMFRSPSPCLFRPSFLGSASKVRNSFSFCLIHY